MPTCGEVSERGRCCPGPRRRAERTSTAPLAAPLARRAPRRGAPAGPGAARWGSRLRRDERGGGTDSPPRRGRSGARQRLLLQARRQHRLGAALPGSPPLRSDRLPLARLSLAQFSSALLRPLRHGAAWLSAAPLGSARLSTGAATGGCASPSLSTSRLRETCCFWRRRRRGAEGRGRRLSRRGGRSGQGARPGAAGLGRWFRGTVPTPPRVASDGSSRSWKRRMDRVASVVL
ncbi:uncharacterized protein [Molothrus aeneus]|uniref:uncharacterized protein n=1 Tax=Molothrus aeneus TaxID=84833 RepID=UPI00345AEF1D